MWLLLVTLIINGISALHINNVVGPDSVQNGSISYLVLDCPFESNEEDRQGLVVKWYFNHDPIPVYQWIPGHKPQDFGMLKGRLDLTHEAAAEDWTKHRALAILNPTTDLSGNYTCKISSFYSEDFKKKKLTVFAPASNAELSYSKPSENSVVLNCEALGLYPQPIVSVYRKRPYLDRTHRSVITEPELTTNISNDTRSYNVSARVTLFDFELLGETVFICEISIPGTKYMLQKELYYSPGHPQPLISLTSGQSLMHLSTILFCSSFILFPIR